VAGAGRGGCVDCVGGLAAGGGCGALTTGLEIAAGRSGPVVLEGAEGKGTCI
jgi:hypothetical protein